jgi:hypothetical protein
MDSNNVLGPSIDRKAITTKRWAHVYTKRIRALLIAIKGVHALAR